MSEYSQVGIFEDYEFSRLQEWYREPDLRDNAERAFIGVADWQTDFPDEGEWSDPDDFDPGCWDHGAYR